MSHRRIRNTKGGRTPSTHGKEHFPTQRTDWPEEEKDKNKGTNPKKEKPNMTDVVSPGTGDRLFRPVFPGERPTHHGPIKKLHSKTGYNLAISQVEENKFKVMGKMDHDAEGDDILELSSDRDSELGEVKIRGVKTNLYIAMDQDGKVYAEPDRNSEATIFYESFANGWNTYASKANEEKGYYLGIKKSGKAKRGDKTARGQNATQFIPRPADLSSIPP